MTRKFRFVLQVSLIKEISHLQNSQLVMTCPSITDDVDMLYALHFYNVFFYSDKSSKALFIHVLPANANANAIQIFRSQTHKIYFAPVELCLTPVKQ